MNMKQKTKQINIQLNKKYSAVQQIQTNQRGINPNDSYFILIVRLFVLQRAYCAKYKAFVENND